MDKNYPSDWASFQVSCLKMTAFQLLPPIEGTSGQIKRQNFGSLLGERYLKSGICCCCSIAQSCLTLCGPMDCSTPGLPVIHHLLELAQAHVHRVGDAIQPSHPLLPPSPPAFNLSQHPGLFKWVSSLHQVAIVLEFQLQHQSFQ